MAVGARTAEPVILALPVSRIADYAVRRGLDRRAMLQRAGVTEQELTEPGRYLPVSLLYEMGAHLVRELGDPSIPFAVARLLRPEDYGVLGFGVLTSGTVRSAIELILQYFPLITTSGRWEVRPADEHHEISWWRSAPLSLGVRLCNEAVVASAVQFLRTARGGFQPARVTFRHRAPPDTAPHAEFFRCPVLFGQDADALLVPNKLLDVPPPHANDAMNDHFTQLIRQRLPDVGPRSIAAQVRGAIADALGDGNPSMRRIARRIALSERSLRRRLAEEGTGFRELLEAVRRDQAARWLAETRSTVAEIATALGFSEPTAFSRAYRKWFGSSPHAARAQAI